eukprot:CAMPEP_0196697150 /NCGR_PEP_ID=MMETSP1090-20130531/41081_1 /TAXON_ID=37098 /ORGANISM="Isochrysis sp, Strain CCMP1244" /LENGTH=46 /DNA_ID= /DNA_START= /DNA_END= /DNA_ORIENTATION=
MAEDRQAVLRAARRSARAVAALPRLQSVSPAPATGYDDCADAVGGR